MAQLKFAVAIGGIGALGVALAVAPAPTVSVPKPPAVSFNRDIRPILSENCYLCHGPAAKQAKANLRLDDFASATMERGGYRVIFPGRPAQSEILNRLHPKSDDDRMPPADTGKRLTEAQVELIRLWIEQGAKYERHWAFIPPKKPAIPTTKLLGWARNDVDRFILVGLERNGLAPAAEATPTQLLRRATLALTGLQPTPSEVQQFLSDKAPGAYERAVDRLLASPRYGENQARYWLDAVRYGDTHGLHLDNERAIYPYRDWVVRAFNEDLPYDKFVKWQLAGDLMPNATTSMKVATGYIRMNPTSNEGGAIEEEFLARNTFDRVDTTSTVFLGLTIGCARCHDHKFDPISQADYYRMFAFFNSTKESPFDGNLLTPDPVMRAPDPDEERELDAQRAALDGFVNQISLEEAKGWLAANRIEAPEFGAWEFAGPFKAENFDKAFDTDIDVKDWKPGEFKFDVIKAVVGAENASGYARTTVTSQVAQEIALRVGSDDGIKVFLNGALIHSNKVLRGADQGSDNVKVLLKQGKNELVFKVVNSGGPDGLLIGVGSPLQVRLDAISKLKDPAAFKKELSAVYLEFGPESARAKQYRAALAAYRKLEASIPLTLVAEELPEPRPSAILRRGEYNLRGEIVHRGVPKALGVIPASAPLNRLGLAEWLTQPQNPLFARVFVNRVWQQQFGAGLVKSAEDFGNQGEWPINPELLDYLAVTFREKGNSLKKLQRMLVTSAAFRQASKLTPDKHLKDPENRLVSRGPRFRLDAEVLRDQALFASGLLVQREGGRGFRPYQPAGLWEEVGFLESTTSRYTPDMTSDIYRRTLYLFWKRTSPHPIMQAFDAPTRETCVMRRARTNTPMQALVVLNEPAFLEAARVFAERVIHAKSTPQARVTLAFQLAIGRDPNAKELAVLTGAAKRYEARYATDVSDAQALIKVGMRPADAKIAPAELASWTLICSTLFNLDEFLTQN